MNNNFSSLISYLLHSRTQAHVFHLQVTGAGAFAAHKALNDYYDSIVGLVDGLVESYQGKYGIITNYSNYNLMSFTGIQQVVEYFTALNKTIEKLRVLETQDSEIQNDIDTVVTLVNSTIYKIKYLA
jgi:DNA-binding ferritin-like protein